MAGETKRLFIGNLTSKITESDLQSKFSKFGTIEAVEIKAKKDNEGNIVNKFAFLDLNTSQESIVKCISAFSNSMWKGHSIKVQIAKESFISRLQRERQENQMKWQDTDRNDNKSRRDSNSVVTRPENFHTHAFSQAKLEQGNKYSPKSNKGTAWIGDVHKNFQSGCNRSRNYSNYDPLEIFLGRKEKQKDENTQSEKYVKKTKIDLQPDPLTEVRKKARYVSLLGKNTARRPHSDIGTATPCSVLKEVNTEKEVNYSDFDSENSDCDEPSYLKCQKMKFDSTQSEGMETEPVVVKSTSATNENSEGQSEHAGSRSFGLHLKLENEMVKRFEVFNDLWKDSPSKVKADGGRKKVDKSLTQSDNKEEKETALTSKKVAKKSKSQKTKPGEKPRMKSEKHASSNQRRLEALKEKQSSMTSQQKAIQKALSVDSGRSGNKIMFDSDDELSADADDVPVDHMKTDRSGTGNSQDQAEFSDNLEDEQLTDAQGVQPQVEGKHSEKKTKLRTSIATDKRFHMDERFYDSEEDVSVVLPGGRTVTRKSPSNKTLRPTGKNMFRDMSQLRFDPDEEAHQKFMLKPDNDDSDTKVTGKKRKRNVKQDTQREPEVPNKKFFSVSQNLASLFKKRDTEEEQVPSQGFSLLKMMGRQDEVKKGKESEVPDKAKTPTPLSQSSLKKNPFHFDSSDSGQEEKKGEGEGKMKELMKGKETYSVTGFTHCFFFQDGDERLKEGADFILEFKQTDFSVKRRLHQEGLNLAEMKKNVKYMKTQQKEKRAIEKKQMVGQGIRKKGRRKHLSKMRQSTR